MSGNTEQQNPSISITLSLIENKCLSFDLTEYALSNKKAVNFESYEFSFTLNFNLLEKEKQARVVLNCKLYEKQGPNFKLEIAELKSTTLFFIQNYDEIIKRDDSKINVLIPNPLIELCNSVTLSSTRGMFSVKLENTLYSNAVFPLIDNKLLLPPQKIN